MSTMNHLCSFLSRLALCGLAVPLILLSPALMRADAITTFDVSGTAQNVSGMKLHSCAKGAICDFSGMFQVDTTKGKVKSSGLDITFPGLRAFDSLVDSRSIERDWSIQVVNTPIADGLQLVFTTAPTLASLKGFTGGSISNFSVVLSASMLELYKITGGSITPVPEPSSLLLFASGMLVLGLTRRFGKKVGHGLGA